MKTSLALISTLAALASGCASYKGLIPDKDVDLEGVTIIVATPWGSQTLKADKFITRVSVAASNAVIVPYPPKAPTPLQSKRPLSPRMQSPPR